GSPPNRSAPRRLAMSTLVSALLQRLQQLGQDVSSLRQQLQKLKGRVDQDSHNSHQPPSGGPPELLEHTNLLCRHRSRQH
ncbi:MAG TPA: hypothetical protein VNT26_16795, partial [Candidatus Sulfotelmatobacter sp.]|nr:hypothetical protein [Candidatus Sulfotelmatobacter sp.]